MNRLSGFGDFLKSKEGQEALKIADDFAAKDSKRSVFDAGDVGEMQKKIININGKEFIVWFIQSKIVAKTATGGDNVNTVTHLHSAFDVLSLKRVEDDRILDELTDRIM